MDRTAQSHPEPYINIDYVGRALGIEREPLLEVCHQANIIPKQRRSTMVLSGSQVRSILQGRGYKYPTKPTLISLMMCKGGVGKTTTSLYLSQRLPAYGAKVLVIDSDPQGNLTAALRPGQLGFTISEKTPVLVDVLTGKCRLSDAILELSPQLHLLPSTAINSLLERKMLESSEQPITSLDRLLRSRAVKYDYIVIDSAPTLNLINAAIIYASDLVILPTQLDEFARLGLHQTVSEIHDLGREFDFQPQVRILLNRFNSRNRHSLLYLGHLGAQFRDLMLATTVRASSEIPASISSGRDLFLRGLSKAAMDYDSLTRELMALNRQVECRHAQL